MARKASVLMRLRALVARSRSPRTKWDYVLIDDHGRTIETFDRKWSAILRREELSREHRTARILVIGYERIYRIAFPRGPLHPDFILMK
jgi:hypothetical protein